MKIIATQEHLADTCALAVALPLVRRNINDNTPENYATSAQVANVTPMFQHDVKRYLKWLDSGEELQLFGDVCLWRRQTPLVKKLKGCPVDWLLFSVVQGGFPWTHRKLKNYAANAYMALADLRKRHGEHFVFSMTYPMFRNATKYEHQDQIHLLNELLRYPDLDMTILYHDRSTRTHAQMYTDLGIPIIPCVSFAKDPKYSGWKKALKPREFLDLLEDDDNVAVKLGEDSGVIALDYDYDVERPNSLHGTLNNLLPPSPCIKIGEKGFTTFYKYNGEKSFSLVWRGKPFVELLSDGRKTVIPPSVHPSTKQLYRWQGVSLAEAVKTDSLPLLTIKGDFKEVRDLAEKILYPKDVLEVRAVIKAQLQGGRKLSSAERLELLRSDFRDLIEYAGEEDEFFSRMSESGEEPAQDHNGLDSQSEGSED
jgi:hypothetical protein